MLHAREDYNRIQDPAGLIPEDEPVFLLRAQDMHAPLVVDIWADRVIFNDGDRKIAELARAQAERMRRWQEEHPIAGSSHGKQPDLPSADAQAHVEGHSPPRKAKQSSAAVSSIAAKIMAMDDAQFWEEVCHTSLERRRAFYRDLRSIAASVVSQDVTPGQDHE